MIKDFNALLSLNDITNCYKNNAFPNAHCLLWNKETSAELLTTQSDDIKAKKNLIGIESEE